MASRRKIKLKQLGMSSEGCRKSRFLEKIHIQIEVKRTIQEAMKKASKKMRVVLTKRVSTRKSKPLKSRAMSI